jgi:hypothetical protein
VHRPRRELPVAGVDGRSACGRAALPIGLTGFRAPDSIWSGQTGLCERSGFARNCGFGRIVLQLGLLSSRSFTLRYRVPVSALPAERVPCQVLISGLLDDRIRTQAQIIEGACGIRAPVQPPDPKI